LRFFALRPTTSLKIQGPRRTSAPQTQRDIQRPQAIIAACVS
jgi:hypothetical protein